MSFIKGKNVVLWFVYNGEDRVIACYQSCSLTTIQNNAETSTVNSGIWRTFRAMTMEYEGSCTGLCSLDTNLTIGQIRQVQFSLQPINIKFISTDDNGLTEIYLGKVIIPSIQNGGTAGQLSDFSIQIKGVGELSILNNEEPPPPDECCDTIWYYYDGVGGEYDTGEIAELVGAAIDGPVYRDGEAYTPSGVNHDATADPEGKEYKFDSTIGKIFFSTELPAIEPGEHVDIPYTLCDSTPTPECIGVSIEEEIIFDNATAGETYTKTIPLTGTAPFNLIPGYTVPPGATLTINSSNVVFVWTPTEASTNNEISFIITNCAGASVPVTSTIDVDESPTGTINWTYDNQVGAGGSMRIVINGTTAVLTTTSNSGSVAIAAGDSVEVIVQAPVIDHCIIDINGSVTMFADDNHIVAIGPITAPAGTMIINGISQHN